MFWTQSREIIRDNVFVIGYNDRRMRSKPFALIMEEVNI